MKPHVTIGKMIEEDIFETINYKKQKEIYEKRQKKNNEMKGFFQRNIKTLKTETLMTSVKKRGEKVLFSISFLFFSF